MLETIKSYLVSLGFAVNDSEFNKVNSALNDFNKNVVATTNGMIKSFAIAGTEVVGSLTAITGATAALIKQTAELDMGYQKFALRMWMTNDSAKDLQVTLRAMGESVEDVAWIPELRQQYFQLLNYGNQMKTPGDAGEQLKYIRSIMFEFTRMKLEVSYAAEWISYYLIKYLSGPLAKAKQTLQEFNDAIVSKMPEWTNKIAKILSMIVTLTINAGRFIYDVYKGFERFFEMMPRGMKILIGALAGLTLAARMNPILLLLSSALLLIDDFYAYMDGRRSLKSLQPVWGKLLEWSTKFNQKMQDLQPLMQDLWEQMVKQWTSIKNKIKDATSQTGDLWDKFKESQTYKDMIDALKNSWDALKNAIQGTSTISGDFFEELKKSMEKRGVLTSYKDMIESISHAIDVTTTAVDNLMIKFNLFSKQQETKTFLTWLADQFAIIGKNVATLGEVFGHIFSAMIKKGMGDYKGALKEIELAAKAATKYNAGGAIGELQEKNKNNSSANSATGNQIATMVSEQSGLPANLIYGQMAHETANFTEMAGSHNYGGLKNSDGTYKDFSSDEEFAKYYAWYLHQYDDTGLSQATTPEEWAHALKQGGYYEDAESTYANGIANWSQNYQPPNPQPSDNTTYDFTPPTQDENPINLRRATELSQTSFSMMNGNYSVSPLQNYNPSSDGGGLVIEGGINISIGGTNATTNDITNAVIQGMQQATGRQISRQTRDLQGAIV